jgi:phosphoglycerol transferase MdoB-like AlkP superfamily enzyme
MTSWRRFISQYQKDLKLWLFCMAVLTAFRICFIVYFRSKLSPSAGAGDILLALMNGMRFDAMAAAYWSVIPFFASAACFAVDIRAFADRVRRIVAMAFAMISPVAFISSIVFFQEYNEPFNHFIFNLYYDDTQAILSTIWSGYHPIVNLLIMGMLGYGLARLANSYQRSGFFRHDLAEGRTTPPAVQIIATVAAVFLLAGSLRGSFGHRPAKIEDSAVTRDSFLNKAVLNPYSALVYAYGAHTKLSRITGGLEYFLPDGNVRGAADAVFGSSSTNDLDDYLARAASGARNRPPRHVFLVVMESYDAWPLMEPYTSLGLSRELGRLGREGVSVRNFLPSSDGTATSLCSLVSGLPDANVVTNYQRSSERPFPSSIALSFKQLGYRTRFFYGGYPSWQRIGEFIRNQGFEESYGGGSMGSQAVHTEWGVEDDALFAFAEAVVAKRPDRPSFNLILTTSYHPPYELDVYGKGFPLREMPKDLAPQFDGTTSLVMLGHLWYSDQCIGNFVRSAETKFPGSLFAFTGDHFSRKFLNDHPPAFEGSAVPFILYGKDVLRGVRLPTDSVGSHIDIGPTLIELAAPKGFRYHAMGRSVFDHRAGPLAFSRDFVLAPQYLLDTRVQTFHPVPGRPLPARLPDPQELTLLHHRLLGISWWRIMRGATL